MGNSIVGGEAASCECRARLGGGQGPGEKQPARQAPAVPASPLPLLARSQMAQLCWEPLWTRSSWRCRSWRPHPRSWSPGRSLWTAWVRLGARPRPGRGCFAAASAKACSGECATWTVSQCVVGRTPLDRRGGGGRRGDRLSPGKRGSNRTSTQRRGGYRGSRESLAGTDRVLPSRGCLNGQPRGRLPGQLSAAEAAAPTPAAPLRESVAPQCQCPRKCPAVADCCCDCGPCLRGACVPRADGPVHAALPALSSQDAGLAPAEAGRGGVGHCQRAGGPYPDRRGTS